MSKVTLYRLKRPDGSAALPWQTSPLFQEKFQNWTVERAEYAPIPSEETRKATIHAMENSYGGADTALAELKEVWGD